MHIFKLFISATLITMLAGCSGLKIYGVDVGILPSESERNIEKDNECRIETEKNHADALNYVYNNIIANARSKNRYELLQSTRYFEEQDKKYLIEFLNAFAACELASAARWGEMNLRYGTRLRQFVRDTEQVYLDFMSKKINVAQLNKIRKEQTLKFESDMSAINEQR